MRKLLVILFLFTSSVTASAQGEIIDEIIAVVGDNMVLRSELEKQYELYKREYGYGLKDTFRCTVLDELIAGKLLLFKAQLDSMEVGDDRVESEIDRKIRYLSAQVGGQTKLEEYLGMPILEYKAKIKEDIRQQMLATDMQNTIISDVKVSHADIVKYFEEIPDDSLPLISAEYEVAQLVFQPKPSQVAEDFALRKIQNLRKRVLAGESFEQLAIFYSEDPGSSYLGGVLDYFGRGQMAPEFEGAAFSLNAEDSLSEIIKTQFGYHLIKYIDRKGDQVNAAHILIRPKLLKDDLQNAANLLDSIKKEIEAGRMTFEDAVKKYSTDEETKPNGGFFKEQTTGSSMVPIDQLDRSLILSLDAVDSGEISNPLPMYNRDGSQAFRLIYLKSEVRPHTANLSQDYQKIKAAATEYYEQKALTNWLNDFSRTTYIYIEPIYNSCGSLDHWLIGQKQAKLD